ncbi:hypothetical protein L1887_42483 [Cichorium endivia]|nr:hypothetical protein L1887_42483 [Cichorium endivia]
MQARISCSPERYGMTASDTAPAATNLPLSASSLVAPTSAKHLTHVPSVPWHREPAGLTLATFLPWRRRGTLRTYPRCSDQSAVRHLSLQLHTGPVTADSVLDWQMRDPLRWTLVHRICLVFTITDYRKPGGHGSPKARSRLLEPA